MTGKRKSSEEQEKKSSEEQAFKAATGPPDDSGKKLNTITLSSGVVLKMRRVAPLAISDAVARVKEPEVPRIFQEDKGREEENPEHPDYKRAMEKYEETTGLVAMNVLLLMGTSIESIPEELSKPEDEDWIENLEFLEVKIDKDSPKARYLGWLRYYALTSDQDFMAVMDLARSFAGVKEEDVQAAAKSFPSEEARRANSDRLPETQS